MRAASPSRSVHVRRAHGRSVRQAAQRQAALSFWYGLPTAAGGMLRPTTPARMTMVMMYGRAAKNWFGTAGQELAQLARGRPDADRRCRGAPRPRTAAPPTKAPTGVQRPKMTAASAMKPRPAVMPFWNVPVGLQRQVAAGQAGQRAAEDDVPVAQPDDVDADRVGRLGMLARRPACAGPSATGTA